jgi:zinc/manganese transport system permease protein
MPFIEYGFLRRALLACWALSLASAPLGVILILRRLSMTGEALSHAVLPGLAAAFLMWGLWLPGMTLGGLIAGLCVSLISHTVARTTKLHQDATLASFYIMALALGILMLSLSGGQMHAMHILFGSILAVDEASLNFIALTSLITLGVFKVIYRPLVYDCFDPFFARSVGIHGTFYTNIFLALVVCVLIAACQAMGTLMAIGVMVVPCVTACLLGSRLRTIMLTSALLAMAESYMGIVLSYMFNWPTGPTIILLAGLVYMAVFTGVRVRQQLRRRLSLV